MQPGQSPTASTSRATGERFAALDGLRGAAALAVVYAHACVWMGLVPYAPLGAIGVLVFFVLSGYLIATICWPVPATSSSYLRFLRRRVVRLGPVVVAVVLLGGPVVVLAGGVPAPDVVRDGVLTLGQVTAFALAAGVDVSAPFLPTWSLSVEWTFYLVFPLVLFGLRRAGVRPRRVTHVLAVSAVALYLAALPLAPLDFYVLPVANLGLLFAGAALAVRHRDPTSRSAPVDPARPAMALVLLGILTVLPGHTLGWGWKAAVLPATGVATLVVIHAVTHGDRSSRLLGSRPLRAVGLRAYSIYLWHAPVMWTVWSLLPSWPSTARALLALVVVGVLAPVSFVLLERPVLRSSAAPTALRPRPRGASAVPALEQQPGGG